MNLRQIARRTSLSDEVATALRTNIVSGEWPIGAKIPTEPELVELLGVARNTVREAVRSLVHTGLLQTRQGSGTYVVATSELSSVMRARFESASLEDVNDFRAALESTAARLAAQRRTKTDVRRIATALSRREQAWATGDATAFADADANFHLTVVGTARNTLLTELYADVAVVVRDRIAAELGKDTPPEKYVDHSELMQAINDGDADRAGAEAAHHPHSWTRRRSANPK